MIVRMKKVTLLVLESQREEALRKLRGLGVVHVKHIKSPAADEITLIDETLSRANGAVAILKDCRIPKEAQQAEWKAEEVPDKVNGIISLAAEKEELLKNIRHAERRMEEFRPWGAFDPKDLRAFEDSDIIIRLYRAAAGAFRKTVKERRDIRVISEEGRYVYIAQICGRNEEALPFEEVALPEESYEELYGRRESLKERIGSIERELRAMARAEESLKERLAALKRRRAFLDVMHGMGSEKNFSYLQGFSPVDRVKDIVEFAQKEGLGYLMEDPDPSENVPTLIRNPKWIRIINPVFKFMNTLPGYNEFDISFWFLLFFSVFFAMLIGDAAYGLIFLGATYLARRKFKSAPRETFVLMYVLSIATVIWGAVTGTWFGAEEIAKAPFLNSLVIRRINIFVDTNREFIIYICFIIGAVQLILAHIIKGLRILNSPKALAEFGWILAMGGLFYTAGNLVLNRPFPAFAAYLLAAGASLILLFSHPQRNILKGAAASLTTAPLKIISSFADVVSYMRLFAVGYATAAVAAGFNKMALLLGFDGIIRGLGAALIMVLGHSLNIILGLMAVIVHGIRLNMLEFSGQIGMEWSGTEYKPFRDVKEGATE